MSEKASYVKTIPDEMLVGIIKKATDIHSKVAVCLSGIVGDYEYFTVLELAKELAERFPLSKNEMIL